MALRYFTDSFTPDPAVMPRVIQTLDTYGREEAFPFRFEMTGLVQSEATIDWAIQELRQIRASELSQYFSALCHMLAEADPALLEPRRQEILALQHFEPDHLSTLKQRLELAGWDVDRCWQELESMCDAAIKDPDEDVFDWHRSDQLAEVVGRQGQACADRVLELLADPVEREQTDPVQWMETFLVQVAGYLRLEAAIPSLVTRLRRKDDSCPRNAPRRSRALAPTRWSRR